MVYLFRLILRQILSAALVLSGLASSAFASSLEDLEATTAKAETLQDFLANKDLQNEYFKKLQAYYGADKVARTSYDTILRQMEDLAAKVPEFAERAWALRAPKSWRIQTLSDIKVNIEKRDRLLQSYRERLARLAAPVRELSDPQAYINQAMQRYNQIIQEAEKQAASLGKQKRTAKMAEVYKSIRDDKAFAPLSAYLTEQRLSSPLFRSIETATDESILAHLETFRAQAMSSSNGAAQIPESFRSMLREHSMKPSDLLNEAGLLTDVNGQPLKSLKITGETWDFKTPARSFHAFMDGIPLNECVGGCRVNLESLSPDRWAAPSSTATDAIMAEVSGKPKGHVQAVKVKLGENQYTSLDLLVPEMGKSIVVRNGEKISKTTLFDAFLETTAPELNFQTKGFVVGSTNAINNAGGAAVIRSSGPYIFGEAIHPPKLVTSTDAEYERKITAASEKHGHARTYSNLTFIHETGVQNPGVLTVLASPRDATGIKEKMADPEFIKRSFQSGLESEARVLSYFAHNPASKEIEDLLRQEVRVIFKALKDPNDKLNHAARSVIEYGNPDTTKAILSYHFRPAESVIELRDQIASLPLSHDKFKRGAYQYFETHIKRLVRSSNSDADILQLNKAIQKSNLNSIELATTMTKRRLELARSTREFRRASQFLVDWKSSPTDAYRVDHSKTIVSLADRYMLMKPSNFELQEFVQKFSLDSKHSNMLTAFLKKASPHLTDPAQFIAILSHDMSKYNDKFRKEINTLTTTYTKNFLDLKPSGRLIYNFEKLGTTVESSIGILKEALRANLLSGSDFASILLRISSPTENYQAAVADLFKTHGELIKDLKGLKSDQLLKITEKYKLPYSKNLFETFLRGPYYPADLSRFARLFSGQDFTTLFQDATKLKLTGPDWVHLLSTLPAETNQKFMQDYLSRHKDIITSAEKLTDAHINKLTQDFKLPPELDQDLRTSRAKHAPTNCEASLLASLRALITGKR